MCDRTRCGGTYNSCHSTQSDEVRWPNMTRPVEMDFTGGCCNHKDNLITAQPPCLDPATWPQNPCNKKSVRTCSNSVKEKALPPIAQAWPEVEHIDHEWHTQMDNCDARKYHIPGYGGYVPRMKFGHKFGTYSISTHQALNEFSDAQRGLCPPGECECPPDPCWSPEKGKKSRPAPSCHIGCGMVPHCS